MSGRLDGRAVAVLIAEGFEDLEFWVTVMRLREEGARVRIAGLEPGVPVTREERPPGGRRRTDRQRDRSGS